MFVPHFPEELSVSNMAYRNFLMDYFKANLDYDNSTALDSFSDSTVSYKARVIAKGSGFVSGLDEIAFLLKSLNAIDIETEFTDGDDIEVGDVLLIFDLELSSISFKYERLILNILSRLCGISTLVREYVNVLDDFDYKVSLLSTRKVLLGPLDKKAFVVGGGLSHRLNQGDALMFKKYHKNLYGLSGLIEMVMSADLSKYKFVEFEVHSDEEARELFESFPAVDIPVGVMFDNFEPEILSALLKGLKYEGLLKCDFTEASGGINLDNLKEYDIPYLDFVSVGEITKNSQAVDLSFDLERR